MEKRRDGNPEEPSSKEEVVGSKSWVFRAEKMGLLSPGKSRGGKAGGSLVREDWGEGEEFRKKALSRWLNKSPKAVVLGRH